MTPGKVTLRNGYLGVDGQAWGEKRGNPHKFPAGGSVGLADGQAAPHTTGKKRGKIEIGSSFAGKGRGTRSFCGWNWSERADSRSRGRVTEKS